MSLSAASITFTALRVETVRLQSRIPADVDLISVSAVNVVTTSASKASVVISGEAWAVRWDVEFILYTTVSLKDTSQCWMWQHVPTHGHLVKWTQYPKLKF